MGRMLLVCLALAASCAPGERDQVGERIQAETVACMDRNVAAPPRGEPKRCPYPDQVMHIRGAGIALFGYCRCPRSTP